MFEQTDALANLAVKDMARAKEFYEGILGLKKIDSMGDDVTTYQTGASKIIVYRSEFAGTNKATALGWEVGEEIEAIVDELKSKGVNFEHYDNVGANRKGDLHIYGPMAAAWFKDPDGNILSLMGAATNVPPLV